MADQDSLSVIRKRRDRNAAHPYLAGAPRLRSMNDDPSIAAASARFETLLHEAREISSAADEALAASDAVTFANLKIRERTLPEQLHMAETELVALKIEFVIAERDRYGAALLPYIDAQAALMEQLEAIQDEILELQIVTTSQGVESCRFDLGELRARQRTLIERSQAMASSADLDRFLATVGA